MNWLQNAEKQAKKKQKEKDDYRPTPKWLLKKWGQKRRNAARARAEKERKKKLRRAKRKARDEAFVKYKHSGGFVPLADGDENWREWENEL